MAGNRARQRAFEIPILLELATLGRVDARRDGRRRSRGVEELLGYILSYFHFSAPERRERHDKSGQLVLENDVLWAVKQLESSRKLQRKTGHEWVITDDGLLQIRNYLHDLLRKRLSDDEVTEILLEAGCSDGELVLEALQCLARSTERLPDRAFVALMISSDSLAHLFRNTITNLPLDEFGKFLTSSYEVFKAVVSRDLAERKGLAVV